MTGATKASPQPLDRLYEIDTPLALCHCLTAFQTAVKDTFATLSQADEDALIAEILAGDKPIHPDLYRRYADNLRRAVQQVPVDDNLAAQWQANVSRFAAYKAYHATNDIRAAADTEHARTALHNYNRWQAAEYNTAVTRARTGRQWQQWDNPDDRRLFPNIKWIPSRSATPREEHIPFYNRIWPKDDPFWQNNQPGNLWNCKCDWQQTDEPATDGNPADDISKPGLRGNPATTGQIFSDDASYINSCSNNNKRKIEKYTATTTFRADSITNLHKYQGKDPVKQKIQGNEIDVIFDSKTTNHIANDITNSHDFLMKELSDNLPKRLERSTLVAHEPNAKIDKKPSAIHYYYYKYQIGNKDYYFAVEENYVSQENRHYYRLYAITNRLRDSAILYN